MIIEDLLKRGLALRTEMSDDTGHRAYIVDSSPTETGVLVILAAAGSISGFKNRTVVVKTASFQITLQDGASVVISQYYSFEDGNYLYKSEDRDQRSFLSPLGFLLEELGFDFGAFEAEGLVADRRSG